MKYCRKCGSQLRDESEFCSKCGARVTGGEKVADEARVTDGEKVADEARVTNAEKVTGREKTTGGEAVIDAQKNGPQKDNKIGIVIIIVSAIVIISVALIILLSKGVGKDFAEKTEEISTEAETESLTVEYDETDAVSEIPEETEEMPAEKKETEAVEIIEESVTEEDQSESDNGFIGEWTLQDARGLFIVPEEDHYRVTYEEYGVERPVYFAITCIKDGDRLIYDNEMYPEYEIDENGVNIPTTMDDRGSGFFEIADVYPDATHDPYGGEYTMQIAAREYPINEDTSPCLLWFKKVDDTAAYNPFYGIWVGASKNEAEAQSIADAVSNNGFEGKVYVSSQWANLNPERWYVVTAGTYQDEEDANNALQAVKMVYPDAYVKYSGMCIATPW